MNGENACWNCRWENLDPNIEPCFSCHLHDKWEKKTHDQTSEVTQA